MGEAKTQIRKLCMNIWSDSQAHTQKFLKVGGFGTDGEFPRKSRNSIHEMTLLEVPIAHFRILGCNLHITPVTH